MTDKEERAFAWVFAAAERWCSAWQQAREQYDEDYMIDAMTLFQRAELNDALRNFESVAGNKK